MDGYLSLRWLLEAGAAALLFVSWRLVGMVGGEIETALCMGDGS